MPRIINVICDAALVFGYAEERRQIDLPLMREVLAELETTGVLPSDRSSRPAPSCELAPRTSRPQPAQAGAATAVLPAGRTLATYEQELRQAEAVSRAAMEQAARRAAEMEQREAALRQRERELAEQRRVLAEEYRLLRVQRAAASAPPRRARAPGRPVSTRPAPDHFTASRPGFWAWLKRVATGGSHRAMEGN